MIWLQPFFQTNFASKSSCLFWWRMAFHQAEKITENRCVPKRLTKCLTEAKLFTQAKLSQKICSLSLESLSFKFNMFVFSTYFSFKTIFSVPSRIFVSLKQPPHLWGLALRLCCKLLLSHRFKPWSDLRSRCWQGHGDTKTETGCQAWCVFRVVRI